VTGAIKRIGAVASASALLAFSAGCTLSTPGRPLDPVDAGDGGFVTDAGDGGSVVDATVNPREFELCAIDYRMAGDIAIPEFPFTCSAELTDEAPSFGVPLWEFGETCESVDDATWATFEVTETSQIAVSFPNGSSSVKLDLYDPEGAHVIQLTPERPCVSFEAEPGQWVMEISPQEPVEGETRWFEVAVDFVED
jgi:hypothetical protein